MRVIFFILLEYLNAVKIRTKSDQILLRLRHLHNGSFEGIEARDAQTIDSLTQIIIRIVRIKYQIKAFSAVVRTLKKFQKVFPVSRRTGLKRSLYENLGLRKLNFFKTKTI